MRRSALLLALLAACAASSSGAREAGRTVPDDATAVPSTDGASMQGWTADFDRVGPVRVGMSIAEAEAAVGGSFSLEGRVDEEIACDYAAGDALPEGVALMVWGDTVVRVDVFDPGVPTVRGVGVGDPEARVLATYAGSVGVEPHPYDGPEGHYLVVEPAAPEMRGMGMILETDGERVGSYRVGRMDAVRLIEGCS